jgi:hypothetical protein
MLLERAYQHRLFQLAASAIELAYYNLYTGVYLLYRVPLRAEINSTSNVTHFLFFHPTAAAE